MRFSYIVILGLIAVIVFGVHAFILPMQLNEEVSVEIPYGTSVSKSASLFKEAGIIKRTEGYIILSKIFYPEGITAGTYSFSGNISMFGVLYRAAHGIYGRDQVRLTIPEGFTIEEIIARINALFQNVDIVVLQESLKNKEGYIFPETYFFDKDAPTEKIITSLIQRSNSRLSNILAPVELTSAEAKRIIIIASLVESEGKTKEERHMIAGIIDNRLRIDMPLQLDATLTYITGRGSSQLTMSDLKNSSLYNTYVHKGLPPGPISNPGEESIRAAIEPKENDYYYYLHGKDGKIYYAKTFAEHVKNKDKYLR